MVMANSALAQRRAGKSREGNGKLSTNVVLDQL